jgi:hypothetical protein
LKGVARILKSYFKDHVNMCSKGTW